MWGLSASRWICPLSLVVGVVVMMLLSASEVDSYNPIVGLSCCRKVTSRRFDRIRIKACYEQTPREDCSRHAFRIVTKRNKEWCIDPAAAWLKDRIEKGKLVCRPEVEITIGVPQPDVA